MEIYDYAITAAPSAALPVRERASVFAVWHPAPVAGLASLTVAVPAPQQGISVFGAEHGRTIPGAAGALGNRTTGINGINGTNGTTGINGINGTTVTKKRMDLRGVPPRGRPV